MVLKLRRKSLTWEDPWGVFDWPKGPDFGLWLNDPIFLLTVILITPNKLCLI
jgi:hypothetical protein